MAISSVVLKATLSPCLYIIEKYKKPYLGNPDKWQDSLLSLIEVYLRKFHTISCRTC